VRSETLIFAADMKVRNRAKEIAELLADVDRIRQERRKAKANRITDGGTGNDGAAMSFTSGGSRYGGFGSETLGGASAGGGYEPDSGLFTILSKD
jgi:epsin